MRNSIISALISICLPFLPFWEWDGTGEMLVAAAVFYWITLAIMVATENKEDRIR